MRIHYLDCRRKFSRDGSDSRCRCPTDLAREATTWVRSAIFRMNGSGTVGSEGAARAP